ncbi:hypothetical protein IT407_03945 [Candidatus Uhrbacteria bacterium]|nr:hypothetical protein [Candidatus Uhrbacteria bacterium]
MQRASYRSRTAPSSRFNEGSWKPSLILIKGGKSRTIEDEGLELITLLLRIWFPWDFRHSKVPPMKSSPALELVKTDVYPILTDEMIDEIIEQNPIQSKSLDERYEEMTRKALEPRSKKPRRKPKPRTINGLKLPLLIHPRALGQFVRFFFNTKESTRAYIDRKLKQQHGAEVVACMDYAELAHKRSLERKGLIMRLSTLIAKHGKRSREDYEWRIFFERENRSPRAFWAEFNPKTGEIIKFLLEKDRGRRKAFKTARKRCYRRNH